MMAVARKMALFCLIGGGVFVIGQAMLFILVDKFYWYPSVANAVQLVVTFGLNYYLNKRLTWRDCNGRDIFQRFVLARVLTVLLSFVLFSVLVAVGMHYQPASMIGVATGMVINYVVSDRWVFANGDYRKARGLDDYRLGWRTVLAVVVVLAASLGGLYIGTGRSFVTALLVLFALVALSAAALFLVSLLYPNRNHGSSEGLRPRESNGNFAESFAVLMPARHEVTVLGRTMINAAWTQRHHPRHQLVPVVCDDDPDTIRVALLAARLINWWHRNGQQGDLAYLYDQFRHGLTELQDRLPSLRPIATRRKYVDPVSPEPLTEAERGELDDLLLNGMLQEDALVQLIIFPLNGRKPSKPLQLNFAFKMLQDHFTVFTILDAESMAAQDLLAYVDQAFQDRPEVDIIQGGVQLMNPVFTGTRGQKLRQYWKRWFSWHNLLEYYRCYSGQFSFLSDMKFLPLGGNTVFVRTGLLRKTNGWPETLTEDCALGVLATAVHSAQTYAFYSPALATHEETPPNVKQLIGQRVRWNQGFFQSLVAGHWRALPTVRQRLLALWVLSSPFFQAFSASLLPVTVLTILYTKSSPVYVLVMYTPVAAMVIAVALQLKQLREFAHAYSRKVAWHVYLFVVVTQPVYQWVLSYAALRAVMRHIKGNVDWHKTEHVGDHIAVPATSQ